MEHFIHCCVSLEINNGQMGSSNACKDVKLFAVKVTPKWMGVNGNANASEVLLQDGSSCEASTSGRWITPLVGLGICKVGGVGSGSPWILCSAVRTIYALFAFWRNQWTPFHFDSYLWEIAYHLFAWLIFTWKLIKIIKSVSHRSIPFVFTCCICKHKESGETNLSYIS